MKRFGKGFLLLVSGLMLFMVGCGKPDTDVDNNEVEDGQVAQVEEVTEAEPETESNEPVELPPYQYYGEDKVEAAIAAFMSNIGSDGYATEEGSVAIPAPVIVKTETLDDGRVKVYGNFWVFNYVPEGSTLSCISGGEYPGIIYLETSGDGYLVNDVEFAGDGADYAKDIVRFSDGDKALEDDLFEAADTSKKPFLDARAKYITDYLVGSGLDQQYDSYQDYGWDPVYLSDAEN